MEGRDDLKPSVRLKHVICGLCSRALTPHFINMEHPEPRTVAPEDRLR